MESVPTLLLWVMSTLSIIGGLTIGFFVFLFLKTIREGEAITECECSKCGEIHYKLNVK